ncbi:hypothetical protein [Paraburkholderia caribensis]|uniref:hypothetical protein n=1 Tax=Paraburkholderia caribensis TaxID=75105 RepID=UPI00078BB618|nr:hypothetical protein [Paraburkholderia caribensis]AMV43006.1 hypothetical protein ATN79_10000 [Paraburkholderia caribensis]
MQASSTDRAECYDDGDSSTGSSVDPLTQLSSRQSDALIQYGARMKKVWNEPRMSNLPECDHSTIAAEVAHFDEALR